MKHGFLQLRDGRKVRFPAVMGILNVTPDSFSDGGRYLEVRQGVARALEMEAAGASIIDIGGESTRPGACEVSVEEELARVIPLIGKLAPCLNAPISIDTRKAAVADAALAAGAVIVNDVSGLEFDAAMAGVVARARAAVVIMHMRGTPATMMRRTRYRNVVEEVIAALGERARRAIEAGISRARIIIDPGLGFAKRPVHSLRLLGAIPRLVEMGYPVLIGASRKSFVRAAAGTDETSQMFGTAAACAIAIAGGAAIVRVHDPAPAAAVVRMAAAVARAAIGG